MAKPAFHAVHPIVSAMVKAMRRLRPSRRQAILWGLPAATGALLVFLGGSSILQAAPDEQALTVISGMENRLAGVHSLWGRSTLDFSVNSGAADPRARSGLSDRMQPNAYYEELAFDGSQFRNSIEYKDARFNLRPLELPGALTKQQLRWSDGEIATAVTVSTLPDGSTDTFAVERPLSQLQQQSTASYAGFDSGALNCASSVSWLDLEANYLPMPDVTSSSRLLRRGNTTLAGTENVNNVECNVLQTDGTKWGAMRFWVAPSLGFATVKVEQTRMENEGDVRKGIAVTEFSDFAEYGAVWFPRKATRTTYITFTDGVTYWGDKWTLDVTELHVNEPVPSHKLALPLSKGTTVLDARVQRLSVVE